MKGDEEPTTSGAHDVQGPHARLEHGPLAWRVQGPHARPRPPLRCVPGEEERKAEVPPLAAAPREEVQKAGGRGDEGAGEEMPGDDEPTRSGARAQNVQGPPLRCVPGDEEEAEELGCALKTSECDLLEDEDVRALRQLVAEFRDRHGIVVDKLYVYESLDGVLYDVAHVLLLAKAKGVGRAFKAKLRKQLEHSRSRPQLRLLFEALAGLGQATEA